MDPTSPVLVVAVWPWAVLQRSSSLLHLFALKTVRDGTTAIIVIARYKKLLLYNDGPEQIPLCTVNPFLFYPPRVHYAPTSDGTGVTGPLLFSFLADQRYLTGGKGGGRSISAHCPRFAC